jgi:hypothetical protein
MKMMKKILDRAEPALSFDDAEAEFLSGGNARALCCEPDPQVLSSRPVVVKTLLLSPQGPVCC